MFKPKDYRVEDDDYRAGVTLLVLELNQLIYKHYGRFKDPTATFFIMSAVAHGCSIGTPFTVSTIAQLTNHSRRKVYAVLDELLDIGWIKRGHIKNVPHPVYIRNLNHRAQKEVVPTIYSDFVSLFRTLARNHD